MKDDKYLVVGEATDMAQMVKTLKTEPCDPCTLSDARARAYRFAAMLVKQVTMRGGEVEIIDVAVEEPRAPRKPP